jgi:hypothetical protein
MHQTSLPDEPQRGRFVVLTADTGHDAKRQSAQEHPTTLSTNRVDRVAKATTHESLIDDEADSAATSTAIHDVVASGRPNHSPRADRGDDTPGCSATPRRR